MLYSVLHRVNGKHMESIQAELGIVTTKGQVVIPARLRRRFGIKKGTVVAFVEENGRLIIQPITQDFIRDLRGSLETPTKDERG